MRPPPSDGVPLKELAMTIQPQMWMYRGHEHGPARGHEAVQLDDHVDHVDGEHRHWRKRDHWGKH